MAEVIVMGVEELKRKLAALSNSLATEGVEKATLAAGYVVETRAKIYVPVDTGFLRSTIQTKVAEKARERVTVDVSAFAHYAPFVELGTVRMRQRPYLRPAVDQHISEIANAAAKTFQIFIVNAIK